jgi:hypothetical protein
MCRGPAGGRLFSVPILTIAVPALWVTAALSAGLLPHAQSAAALRRRALLTLGAAGAAGITGLLLAPPLLTILAAIVAGVSMPRLIRVRTAARGLAAAGPETPASPALRAAAAHPAVVVPVQATAYTAVAVLALSTVVAPAAAATLFAGLASATAVTVGWHASRHRRLRAGALVLGRGQRAAVRP